MKNLILEIEKGVVERNVAQTTAYTGAKSEGGGGDGVYDRVATIEGDGGMVERFVRDACCTVAERLKEFVTTVNYAGESIRLSLEMSDAYDESMLPAARNGFESYLTACAIARWMRLAYPAKAPEWETEASWQLTELERNLYHRRKPRRRGR